MNISIGNYIRHKESWEGEVSFSAFSPFTKEYLKEEFANATPSEFERAKTLGRVIFCGYPTLVNGEWVHRQIEAL